MFKVPIKKINRNFLIKKVSDELRVNLRNNKKTKKKPLSRKQLISVVFLFLAAVSLGYAISFLREDEFRKIVPSDAVIFSLVDQNAFYQQIFSSDNGKILTQMNDYLRQNELELEKDIQPLFENRAALVLFSFDSNTHFPFVAILKKKNLSSELDNILESLKLALKRNWNIFPYIYRQVEVGVLKPVISFSSELPELYVFAQTRDYFIISNSEEAMKKIIDAIMDN